MFSCTTLVNEIKQETSGKGDKLYIIYNEKSNRKRDATATNGVPRWE